MLPIVLGIVVGLLLVWLLLVFNRLVRLRNRVRESFSGVDVQLKRRHDLVPSLVETVKGYAQHEKSTLEDVVAARRDAQAASAIPDKEARETALGGAVRKLMLLAESYPDLKADRSFRSLQQDLVKIEDDLQYARRYYNGTVRDYNTAQSTFPALLVASWFGHREEPFFQVDDAGERAVPDVALGDASANDGA